MITDSPAAATAERPAVFASSGTALDDLAQLANASHAAAETCARSAVHHARECGETLTLAKTKLKHGEFGRWVRANCKFSERQSRRYMLIALKWDSLLRREVGDDSKRTRVADLPLEGLSIREALKILSTSEKSPADRDVYQADKCPGCGNHLAEIHPGRVTCINCWDCKVFVTSKVPDSKPRYRLLDAQEAWRRMSDLDRAEFLLSIGKSKSPASNEALSAPCPKGGVHEWVQDDDGAYCGKCLEPAGGDLR